MSEADVQYTDTYGEKTYDNLMQILGDSTTENTEDAAQEDAAPSEDAAQQEQAAE